MTFLKSLYLKFFPNNFNKQKIPVSFNADTIFLVSYPKSGNTWLRFLIGNYITEGKIDFYNSHLFMPDIHYNPKQINQIQFKPPFIKSHFPYRKEYKNVIYLVRDGRETAVSYYYFELKMKQIPADTSFASYLENYFLEGKGPYGSWGEHVFSWLRDNSVNNILLLKYEEILADTDRELRRILEFSGIPVDEERLRIAIERSSFSSMKKDEENKPDFIKKLGMDSAKTGYGFVRAGKTNSWRGIFTKEEEESFWKKYGGA